MREAMRGLNAPFPPAVSRRGRAGRHGRDDLLLKIGIHEGPCLAVSLNDRQDYFGQTVNIASRVQGLALSQSILARASVIENAASAGVLGDGCEPKIHHLALRGVGVEVPIYEVP
jgi:class 3 adenylate cyclase